MQRLEVSCAVRPTYGLLGAKGLSIMLWKLCLPRQQHFKNDDDSDQKHWRDRCMILNLPIWLFHTQQTASWVSLMHHHHKQGSDINGSITHRLP
jgi:hypothetical protein